MKIVVLDETGLELDEEELEINEENYMDLRKPFWGVRNLQPDKSFKSVAMIDLGPVLGQFEREQTFSTK